MDSDNIKDKAYSIVKGGLGAVPFAGAAAVELFTHIVTPPIEKRRIEWMHDIGERLAKLESQGHIDLSELQENPEFIDTVIQTTQFALRTSEAEKIEYFRNALLNTALGDSPDKSESQIFLNLIDTYTIWHIRILKLFDNPSNWFREHDPEIPNSMSGSLFGILITAFPELKGRDAFCDLVWNDLNRAGLHDTGSLKTTMSGNGLMVNRTTESGEGFLSFIEQTPENN